VALEAAAADVWSKLEHVLHVSADDLAPYHRGDGTLLLCMLSTSTVSFNCCSLSALMSAPMSALMSAGTQGGRVVNLVVREGGKALPFEAPCQRKPAAAAAAAASVRAPPVGIPDRGPGPTGELGDAALEAAAGAGSAALQVASEDRPTSGELHASSVNVCSDKGTLITTLCTASRWSNWPFHSWHAAELCCTALDDQTHCLSGALLTCCFSLAL
jgi:hypothetical protein